MVISSARAKRTVNRARAHIDTSLSRIPRCTAEKRVSARACRAQTNDNMDQPDQPHDMQRDASPSEHYPKGAPPPLPQEYGWPNDIDHPPACCWHCKCFFLCCGGCCDEAQLPLGVRIVDFIAANMFWWTGMYVGGNYNRDRLERLMNRTAVPAGIDKINGVRSWDSYVQSSVDPGYRIRVRIFASTQQPSTPKKPSVMVYFHGGGW